MERILVRRARAWCEVIFPSVREPQKGRRAATVSFCDIGPGHAIDREWGDNFVGFGGNEEMAKLPPREMDGVMPALPAMDTVR